MGSPTVPTPSMAESASQRLRQRLASLTRPRQPETLPAQLDRRRVYVLPTRFGLFFALTLLVMGLGALNYNNNPALLLVLLLAGAANTSLLIAHLQLSGLQVVAIDALPVAAGTPLELHLHARAAPGRNRRGLLVDCLGSRGTLSLADGHGLATLVLPTSRRGWLDPGRMRLSTTRPLGLARAWGYIWPETPLLVYPAPEIQGPPLPEGAGDHAVARLHPAGDDIHQLRDYRRGDPRRAIAWKASARHDSLLVREYEQPQGADIRLDWKALDPIGYEARIQRLAGWVDEAERGNRRYQLLLPGQPPIGPSQGAAHRHACLLALAQLPDG